MHTIQRISFIFVVALAGLLFIAASPVNGQGKKESTCEGKYKGGGKPTKVELLKILKDHPKWFENLRKGIRKDELRANLCEADLIEADLFGADLFGADLTGANLTGANLTGANLTGADLTGADLIEADLFGANLQRANLDEANLKGAVLGRANLERASLYRANPQGASLYRANLHGANLSGAEGLTASQVRAAYNWELAFYSDDFLKELGLPPDHNERTKKKLAEIKKEKKATGAK